ncbi:MAG: hypothetical protein J1F06_06290 [Prevotellaceae bacterium]|nr:hypothetical protein [Prevotellaceae bacterium]
MLRRYPFSLLLAAAIWYVSLIPVPEVDFGHFSWFDKLVHSCMYGALALLVWAEHLAHTHPFRWRRAVVPAVVLPVVMGALVEVAQATLTDCRSGDPFDALANGVGVLCAWGIAAALRCLYVKCVKNQNNRATDHTKKS